MDLSWGASISDSSGAIQDTLTYFDYGNPTETNASYGDQFKYTGQQYDPETGLQYQQARYCNAALGRWISQDPMGFGAGDPNLYRYVSNSPMDATDPSGMIAQQVIGVEDPLPLDQTGGGHIRDYAFGHGPKSG